MEASHLEIEEDCCPSAAKTRLPLMGILKPWLFSG
jgi:hypothetical protein